MGDLDVRTPQDAICRTSRSLINISLNRMYVARFWLNC